MKCPKCGNEMGEGKMYCEICGEEIHIVPDFEPEIENSISDVLNNVADEIDPSRLSVEITTKDLFSTQDMRIDDASFSSKEEKKHEEDEDYAFSRKSLIKVIGVLVGLIIIMLVIFFLYYSRDNSASYQLKKGDAAYATGNYSEALLFYEKAYRLDPEDEQSLYKVADCYMAQEDYERAIFVYESLISYDSSDEKSWDILVGVLSEQKNYTRINELVALYGTDEIKEKYKEYVSTPPSFSQKGGDYDSVVELVLDSEDDEKIYYTLDGSEPGSDCDVYASPIIMRNGSYKVSAVCVNGYGVCSEIVSMEYNIVTDTPEQPFISLDDGKYNVPQLIEVYVPSGVNVYYTSDGTDPGTESAIYTEPISIPVGESQYKFVAISKTGNASETVVRNYSLNVDTRISEEEALNIVAQRQFEIGRVIDLNGTIEGAAGRYMYMYSEMRYVQNRTLYFISEYYQEGTIRMVTGNVFAVDVYDGTIYQAVLGSNSMYVLHSF